MAANGSILAGTSLGDNDLGADSGSVHVWIRDETTSEFVYGQKLLAHDGDTQDHLGYGGAAVSGDGSILAAASPYDDDKGVDSGSVYVWRWNGTSFLFSQKMNAPDGFGYDNLGLGGVGVSSNGTVLVAAAHGNDNASGAVYVWLSNGTYHVFVQKLKAPDWAADDELGYGGTSLSADGSVLVVASHWDDDMAGNSGSVYVWTWNETLYRFLQKLLAPDAAANDWMGYGGASLSFDGSTLVAASPAHDSATGSIYVWRWNGTGFVYLQRLLAPDGSPKDLLGYGGLGISADGTVLSAASHHARLDTVLGIEGGKIYVWCWNATNGRYDYINKLAAPDGTAGDNLGYGGVSVSADASLLTIASRWDDDKGINSGSMYVAILGWRNATFLHCIHRANHIGCVCEFPFTGNMCGECLSGYYGESCTQCGTCSSHGSCVDGRSGNGTCFCDDGYYGPFCDCPADKYCVFNKLIAPDGRWEDRLGYGGVSVSSNGSILAAAAYWDDEQGYDSGSIYIWRFDASTSGFKHVQKLWVPDGAKQDALGLGGVSLSANASILAAGAHGDHELGIGSGSVHVWRWNGISHVYFQKLLAPDGSTDDQLGSGGVGVSADASVLAAAATLADDVGSNSGCVYVWQWNGTAFTYVQKLLPPDIGENDQLGRCGVSLSADGFVLAVGSLGDDDMGWNSGCIHVWQWNGTMFSYLQKLFAVDGAAHDWLGSGGVSLSANGSLLTAAAWGDDDAGPYSGSVYVWQWNGTSFVHLQKLLAPDGSGSDYLGYGKVGLSSDGTVLAAGAPHDDDKDSSSGSLYVWRWHYNSSQFVSLQKLTAPDGAFSDYLGYGGLSLSANGSLLTAASYGDDDAGFDSGSIYVWTWKGQHP